LQILGIDLGIETLRYIVIDWYLLKVSKLKNYKKGILD